MRLMYVYFIGKLDWKVRVQMVNWSSVSVKDKVNRHKGVNGIYGTGKMVNTSKKGQHTYIHM